MANKSDTCTEKSFIFLFYFWHPMLVRPAMKRLFCLKAKNGLGRFAPSALRFSCSSLILSCLTVSFSCGIVYSLVKRRAVAKTRCTLLEYGQSKVKGRNESQTSTTEAEWSHMIGRNRTAPSAGHLFGLYTLQRPLSSQVHLVWPPLHLGLARLMTQSMSYVIGHSLILHYSSEASF